ncbi:MAG: hotdog domain-containing protein [Niveispirillum sp.]|uniref:hotdog domain-containing protein n=1 Tax=Niveispirillum sp. TaxID=1917217 RepID=UPI003BA57E67
MPQSARTEAVPSATRIVWLETITPDMADDQGTLPAGDVLRLMGRAALAAASRYSNGQVMMTGVSSVRFHRSVPAGHMLELTAGIIHADAGAMNVLVDGMSQSRTDGRRTLAFSGYFQVIAASGGSGG